MKLTIEKVASYVGSICFILMMFTIILQIFARFVLKVSIAWTEELSRLLFIYTVYMGAIVATGKGTHIAVDVVTSHMSGIVSKTFSFLIPFLSSAVSFVFFAGSVKMIHISGATVYATMPIVKNSWPYVAAAVSFGIMGVLQLSNAIATLLKRT